MEHWTRDALADAILDFETLTYDKQTDVLDYFNTRYPKDVYTAHRDKRRNALSLMNRARQALTTSQQYYPSLVTPESLTLSAAAIRGCALVFTAGGEGERLRLSLLHKGYSAAQLDKFTKATFALPGFPGGLGTLQINLMMVATFCKTHEIDIPVIITTGPENSITAEVIPELLASFNNFGLRHVLVLPQDERLFLTVDEKIVLAETDGKLVPITQPDETGGPIMKLKQPLGIGKGSALDWCEDRGCSKTIVVQATALYDQQVLPLMAEALGNHNCLGVGILRSSFPPADPYGTFVALQNDTTKTTMIIEQDVRNDLTRTIKDPSGTYFLPFNTGFYAFDNKLLLQQDLPDFATPPKELRTDLPRSPKIGYAATDLVTLAHDPVVLALDPSLFGVLKNADDLALLSAMGKRFRLDKLCEQYL